MALVNTYGGEGLGGIAGLDRFPAIYVTVDNLNAPSRTGFAISNLAEGRAGGRQ
jgi:hypothetical protein